MSQINCVIKGVGHYVPPKVVTNKDLEKLMETNDAWIVERTGIRERRFTEDGISTSQIAIEAAQNALKAAGKTPQDVDMIIAATLSPDFYFPGIGVIIQKKMGMRNVQALDIRAQCSGLVYGLATAHAYIKAGMVKTILLSCAEVHHPLLNLSTDGRDIAVLFGDGAGALVLEAEQSSEPATVKNKISGTIDSIMGSDGGGAEVLTMKLPGTSKIGFLSPEDVANKVMQPRMNGPVVFKNAVSRMLEAARTLLDRNGLKPSDIDMLFPHQANLRINEMVREQLGIPPEKVFNNIHKYGNTTAATIPIAMSEAQLEGRVKKGDLVMTVAFGAGFTWGANLVRW